MTYYNVQGSKKSNYQKFWAIDNMATLDFFSTIIFISENNSILYACIKFVSFDMNKKREI